MLNEYLASLEATGKSERSIKTRKAQLEKFLSWLKDTVGTDDPLTITSIDAARYRKYLQEKGLKPNSVNTALSSIHAFCQWMVDEGKISNNPVRKVERVKTVQTAPRGLDKNEQHRLLRLVEKEYEQGDLEIKRGNQWRGVAMKRDAVMIVTLLYTGVRVSELIKLTVDDVVIGERSGTITVRGKGNKVRTIPLHKVPRQYLSDFIVNYRNTGKYLFEGQRDPQMTSRAVQLIIKKYAESAKIADLTPHVFRHTFAHNLLKDGVSIDKVAAILGHANINTTSIYTRPTLKDLQDAIDRLTIE